MTTRIAATTLIPVRIRTDWTENDPYEFCVAAISDLDALVTVVKQWGAHDMDSDDDTYVNASAQFALKGGEAYFEIILHGKDEV
jgi:hypothetical protein